MIKVKLEDKDIINVGNIALPLDTSKYGYASYDEITKDTNTELSNRKLKSGNMTLKDYANTFEDGYIDMDVYDDDIDCGVAFIWDKDMETSSDPYDQFIDLLANNVKVKKHLTGGYYGDRLICGFSEFAKQHEDAVRKVLNDLYDEDRFECDFETEPEYCFSELIEGLVAGYASENTYKAWLNALK